MQAHVALAAGKEVFGQKRDIFDTFAQGWHLQGDAAETVEQVFAENPGLHLLAQIGLRGRHDARRVIAHHIEHPDQTRLRVIVEIRDFIQHEAAAFGTRQQGCDAVHARQISGLCGDKGLAAAIREIVNGPRDQRFSGAGFARDQHRQVSVHHPCDEAIQRLH